MGDLEKPPSWNSIKELAILTGNYLKNNKASEVNWNLIDRVGSYFYNQKNKDAAAFGIKKKGALFINEITNLSDCLESLTLAKKEKEFNEIPSLKRTCSEKILASAKKINELTEELGLCTENPSGQISSELEKDKSISLKEDE